MRIELRFPVIGETLPSQHGYLMFAAMSDAISEIHGADWLQIATVGGELQQGHYLALNERAMLKMRLPVDKIPIVMELKKYLLDVQGHYVRLGAPTLHSLKPSKTLYARIATISGAKEAEEFYELATKRLREKGIVAKLDVLRRRIVEIRGGKTIGFEMKLRDLSDADSIRLQSEGFGGRGRFGCGFLLPINQ